MGGASSKTNTQKLNKEFFDAVQSSNDGKVKQLLSDKNLDINAHAIEAKTALHLVNSKSTTEILIHAGADVMARDKQAKTPLHSANKAEIAECLIRAGADVMARDDLGKTPLHYADNEKLTECLIRAGADVNAKDKKEFTPLHFVKNTTVLDRLVAAGADLQAVSTNIFGKQITPLCSAKTYCRGAVVFRIISLLPLEQLTNKPDYINNDGVNLGDFWDQLKELRESVNAMDEQLKKASEAGISASSTPNDMEIPRTPPLSLRYKGSDQLTLSSVSADDPYRPLITDMRHGNITEYRKKIDQFPLEQLNNPPDFLKNGYEFYTAYWDRVRQLKERNLPMPEPLKENSETNPSLAVNAKQNVQDKETLATSKKTIMNVNASTSRLNQTPASTSKDEFVSSTPPKTPPIHQASSRLKDSMLFFQTKLEEKNQQTLEEESHAASKKNNKKERLTTH